MTLSLGQGGHLSSTIYWVLVLSSAAWTCSPGSFAAPPRHPLWLSFILNLSELYTFLIKSGTLQMALCSEVEYQFWSIILISMRASLLPAQHVLKPCSISSISCTIHRSRVPLPIVSVQSIRRYVFIKKFVPGSIRRGFSWRFGMLIMTGSVLFLRLLAIYKVVRWACASWLHRMSEETALLLLSGEWLKGTHVKTIMNSESSLDSQVVAGYNITNITDCYWKEMIYNQSLWCHPDDDGLPVESWFLPLIIRGSHIWLAHLDFSIFFFFKTSIFIL